MEYFQSLPEGCILEILSLTSPKDAARSSAISQTFMSATEFDIVWENFLPSDYQDIISRSDSFLVYSTKKELYFSLHNSPIILDGGKLSFSLDKDGKKCFMVAARELAISCIETLQYWDWLSHPNSRFSEVAKLKWVYWLDIQGKIETQILSKRTKYDASLVFQFGDGFVNLETANAYVRFVNCETENEAKKRASVVRVSVKEGPSEKRPHTKRRVDGWNEIAMGNFFNETGEDGEVEARFIGYRHREEGSLIVQGMEFRPE